MQDGVVQKIIPGRLRDTADLESLDPDFRTFRIPLKIMAGTHLAHVLARSFPVLDADSAVGGIPQHAVDAVYSRVISRYSRALENDQLLNQEEIVTSAVAELYSIAAAEPQRRKDLDRAVGGEVTSVLPKVMANPDDVQLIEDWMWGGEDTAPVTDLADLLVQRERRLELDAGFEMDKETASVWGLAETFERISTLVVSTVPDREITDELEATIQAVKEETKEAMARVAEFKAACPRLAEASPGQMVEKKGPAEVLGTVLRKINNVVVAVVKGEMKGVKGSITSLGRLVSFALQVKAVSSDCWGSLSDRVWKGKSPRALPDEVIQRMIDRISPLLSLWKWKKIILLDPWLDSTCIELLDLALGRKEKTPEVVARIESAVQKADAVLPERVERTRALFAIIKQHPARDVSASHRRNAKYVLELTCPLLRPFVQRWVEGDDSITPELLGAVQKRLAGNHAGMERAFEWEIEKTGGLVAGVVEALDGFIARNKQLK